MPAVGVLVCVCVCVLNMLVIRSAHIARMKVYTMDIMHAHITRRMRVTFKRHVKESFDELHTAVFGPNHYAIWHMVHAGISLWLRCLNES